MLNDECDIQLNYGVHLHFTLHCIAGLIKELQIKSFWESTQWAIINMHVATKLYGVNYK